ncbi:Putative protein [Zobellia galactanivorans]|uniref:Uncharacterized protein n=1 Tax=Zobellia galactanivorans (strain DSM 12802 / CCUG 47099 / CIP 106680 / NCIMB 13871 / Dsij) TaxID=63186 RepID=G0L895_ZOBGA|nr:Putative protein [Zobellia galactanivorans]
MPEGRGMFKNTGYSPSSPEQKTTLFLRDYAFM